MFKSNETESVYSCWIPHDLLQFCFSYSMLKKPKTLEKRDGKSHLNPNKKGP